MQFCCMNCKVFVSHSGRAALAGQGETMRYIPKSAGVRGGLLLMCKHNNRDLGFIVSMISSIRNHFSLTSWPHFVNMKHLRHKVNLRDLKDSGNFCICLCSCICACICICSWIQEISKPRSDSRVAIPCAITFPFVSDTPNLLWKLRMKQFISSSSDVSCHRIQLSSIHNSLPWEGSLVE